MGVFFHGVKLYGQHGGWMLEYPRNFTVFASGSVVCEMQMRGLWAVTVPCLMYYH